MRLEYYVTSGDRKSADLVCESEGCPPQLGDKVYLRDPDNKLRIYQVVRVDRAISLNRCNWTALARSLPVRPSNAQDWCRDNGGYLSELEGDQGFLWTREKCEVHLVKSGNWTPNRRRKRVGTGRRIEGERMECDECLDDDAEQYLEGTQRVKLCDRCKEEAINACKEAGIPVDITPIH